MATLGDDAETEIEAVSATYTLAGVDVALACARNRRSSMEDTTLVTTFESTEHVGVGVFDGHGGDAVSGALPALFRSAFRATLDAANERAWLDAAFEHVRAALRARPKRRRRERAPGSTALVALVNRETRAVVVGNLGDCRALHVRADGTATRVTRDHKVADADEAAALRARGGTITHDDIPRCGGMAISRAFGDEDVPALSDEHETHELVLGGRDVLVLASDGLWDALDDERVATIVGRRQTPVATAEQLRDGGSAADNVSVLLVCPRE